MKDIQPKQLAKLPKWAQEEFTDMKRERDNCVQALADFESSQEPTPIFVQGHISDGQQPGPRFYPRYVKARTLQIVWQGVDLRIVLREGGHMNDNCIDLQWSDTEGKTREELGVAFVPHSYNAARLVSKANLR